MIKLGQKYKRLKVRVCLWSDTSGAGETLNVKLRH